jgi:hypothetical protein
MGHGVRTLAQSKRILATGCPASAWTLSFLIMNNWLVGRFGTAARDEVVEVAAPEGAEGGLVIARPKDEHEGGGA